mmetsp:Transcript_12675/g.12708  ORF Transcript_12675/g.12708 Transcript_12675/m.12708 type:complete len:262 (+) Transcript_12675:1-786(+)
MKSKIYEISAEYDIEPRAYGDPKFMYHSTMRGKQGILNFDVENIKEEFLHNPLDTLLPAYISSSIITEHIFQKQEDPQNPNDKKNSSLSQEENISEWSFDFKDMELPSFDFEPKLSSMSQENPLGESTDNSILRPKIEAHPWQTGDSKAKRWGKREDIALFKAFRQCEEQGLITLSSISQLRTNDQISSHEGIKIIRNRLGCRQSARFLANRLRLKLTNKFSVRETKLLKRLLKTYQYNNLNYSKILDYFSGKTLEGLKKY